MDQNFKTTILRFRIRLVSYNLTLKNSNAQNAAILIINLLFKFAVRSKYQKHEKNK